MDSKLPGMTTTGPCMHCGTTEKDRVPLLKMNKEKNTLEDIVTCCVDCWSPHNYGGKSFYTAKADWEGKKPNNNQNKRDPYNWSI